jgi:hypothetical protein
MQNAYGLKVACVMLAGLAVACSARAEDEVTTGVNGAGRLVTSEPAYGPITLEASVFPGLTGFATGLVGFHSADLPGPDFFLLSPTADVVAVLVSIDAGLVFFNNGVAMSPGDLIAFGSAPFDNHPLIQIPAGNPGDVFTATFFMRDRSGAYTDSLPFTMSFTPIPAPGAGVALLGAMLAGGRRRR